MEWNNGPFGINVEMSRITRETNAPWPDSEILFFLAQNNLQEENMIWPLDQWSYGDHLSKFNKGPSKRAKQSILFVALLALSGALVVIMG